MTDRHQRTTIHRTPGEYEIYVATVAVDPTQPDSQRYAGIVQSSDDHSDLRIINLFDDEIDAVIAALSAVRSTHVTPESPHTPAQCRRGVDNDTQSPETVRPLTTLGHPQRQPT